MNGVAPLDCGNHLNHWVSTSIDSTSAKGRRRTELEKSWLLKAQVKREGVIHIASAHGIGASLTEHIALLQPLN